MIEIKQIRKSYHGARGLDGFSLRIEPGELFGLVGPNGAGKTTLIKILSTLIRPDAGQASVAGFDVTAHPQEVKRVLGYMPDEPGLYQDMHVREFLEFFADAFRLSGSRRSAAVNLAVERSGLAARNNAFVEELSFGMKQRLFLARTLLHDPKVLVLDEPATGLDPLARIDLRRQLKELNAQGITILLSSHILADLEDICTRVALISEGRNAADAEGHDLVVSLQNAVLSRAVYEVEVLDNAGKVVQIIGELRGVKVLERRRNTMMVEIEGDAARASLILRQLVVDGINVVKFARCVTTLEDRYKQVFGGELQ